MEESKLDVNDDKSLVSGDLSSVKSDPVSLGEVNSYDEFLRFVVHYMNEANNKNFTIDRFFVSDDILIQKLLLDKIAQIHPESPSKILIGNKLLFRMKSSSQLCLLEMHMKDGVIYSCTLKI
jgi:hypothetical protein